MSGYCTDANGLSGREGGTNNVALEVQYMQYYSF